MTLTSDFVKITLTINLKKKKTIQPFGTCYKGTSILDNGEKPRYIIHSNENY